MGLIRFIRSRKGQGLTEYALLVAGVAFVCALGVSVLGKKTADMLSTYAALIPGGSKAINDNIVVGALFETQNANATIALNMTGIYLEGGTTRLNSVLQPGLADASFLLVDPRVD